MLKLILKTHDVLNCWQSTNCQSLLIKVSTVHSESQISQPGKFVKSCIETYLYFRTYMLKMILKHLMCWTADKVQNTRAWWLNYSTLHSESQISQHGCVWLLVQHRSEEQDWIGNIVPLQHMIPGSTITWSRCTTFLPMQVGKKGRK
jgi:hypothetical protein